MSNKLVSIVIPTLNSASTLDSCLSSIEANNGAVDYEVIVIDGGSTDNTIEIVKQHNATLLLSEKPQSRQRNKGIYHASGEIIAFTDSDCVVSKNWLSAITKHFDDLSISGVGGSNYTPPDDPYIAQCVGALMESVLGSAGARNTARYKTTREIDHNPPSNAAIRKSILLEVGGYPDEFAVGEDVILDSKIKEKGYKLIYDPDLRVYHPREKTISKFAKQMLGYGKGRASTFLLCPKSLPWSYFCVFLFTIGTILSVPVYVLIDFLRPAVIVCWAIYWLAVILLSVYIAYEKRKPAYFPLLPIIAFIEHFMLGLGFIIGLFSPYKVKK